MTCLNKQNSIYIEFTPMRSIVTSSPCSGYLYTLMYCISTRYHYAGMQNITFLHIHHKQGF